MNWPWQDLGSLPDWVEALGTSGALVYLAIQHHRDRAKDREARSEAENQRLQAEMLKHDAEANQARQIACARGWQYSITDGYTVALTVVNDSEHVIKNLSIEITDCESGKDALYTGPAASSTRTVPRLGPRENARMTGRPEFQPPARRHGDDNEGFELLDRKLRLGVSFQDAAGFRWFLQPDGTLLRRVERLMSLQWRVEAAD